MPSPQNDLSSGSCQLHVLTELFELKFNEEGSLYLACNEGRVLSFSTTEQYYLWSWDKVCDGLHSILDNIPVFIKYGLPNYSNCL